MKTENIKIELSDDELKAQGDKLATAEKKLSEAEGALEDASEAWKGTRKALKDEVEQCRTEVHTIAKIYRDGAMEREVEVDERVIDGVVQVFRVDTNETIRTRPLQSGDQLTVPEDGDETDNDDVDDEGI